MEEKEWGIQSSRMSFSLEFSQPSPLIEREDDRALRKAILSLTQAEAKEQGIGKSTLHHLRLDSTSTRPLRIYNKTRRKLELVMRS
jgi:hypothetical protein